jgi:TonB family protein
MAAASDIPKKDTRLVGISASLAQLICYNITYARAPQSIACEAESRTLLRLLPKRYANESAGMTSQPASAEACRLLVERADRLPRTPADGLTRPAIGVAVAVLAHGAIVAALTMTAPPEPTGGGGKWLDAIGVEIVTTPVIEARETHSETTTPATGTMAPQEGEAARDAVANEASKPKAEDAVAEPDKAAVVPDGAEVVPAAPVQQAERDAKPEDHEEKTREKTPAREGGAAASNTQQGVQARARASASAGDVQHYAMQVRIALARNKPGGHGVRGTSIIAFGISPDGRVSFARVASGSGRTPLDDSALSAVRRTVFPKPPDGMSEEQRTYSVPFHFK